MSAVLLLTACAERLELGDGEFAADQPRQQAAAPGWLQVDDFRLQVRADFHVTAKLLSKRRYRWDALADAVPWDFALGWGPLSDERWLRHTRITQGDRFMFWHLHNAPLDKRTVERHSANMHLIPADDQIRQQMEAVPAGAIIRIEGQLVDLYLPDGTSIATSLTRLDSGPGACEIVFVRGLDLVQTGVSP